MPWLPRRFSRRARFHADAEDADLAILCCRPVLNRAFASPLPAQARIVTAGVKQALLSAVNMVSTQLQPSAGPARGSAALAVVQDDEEPQQQQGQQQQEEELQLLNTLWFMVTATVCSSSAQQTSAGPSTDKERQIVDAVVHLGDLLADSQLGSVVVAELLSRLTPLAQQHVATCSPAAKELALQRCALLSHRRCAHLGCTNLPLLLGLSSGGSSNSSSGGSKPARSFQCTGCRAVRFCSEACSRADWRVHRQACRQLAAAAARDETEAAAEGAS